MCIQPLSIGQTWARSGCGWACAHKPLYNTATDTLGSEKLTGAESTLLGLEPRTSGRATLRRLALLPELPRWLPGNGWTFVTRAARRLHPARPGCCARPRPARVCQQLWSGHAAERPPRHPTGVGW